MASFNQITILGHVTRDPAMRYLPSNTPVLELGMATNRSFKGSDGQDREETFFADLTAFGKQAEILNQYVQKGSLLFVTARAKTESWEKDGQKRSKVVFVIENFQLMPKKDAQDNAPRSQETRPAPARPRQGTRPAQQPVSDPIDDQQQFKEDDIPF